MKQKRMHKGWLVALALVAVILLAAAPKDEAAAAAPLPTTETPPAAHSVSQSPAAASAGVQGAPEIDVKPLAAFHGPVAAQDGRFVYTQTGQRARFWGVNLVFSANFPEKAEAETMAADIARLGFNLVRLHGFDSSNGDAASLFEDHRRDTVTLSASQLDKLDYLVFQLKEQGIYVNINLNSKRFYTEADGVRDAARLPSMPWVQLFDPQMVALQKQFATQLLGHYNPYTGAAYAQEPAVAMLEISNEISLAKAWVDGKLDANLTPYYADMLASQWADWLAGRYGPDGAAAAWGGQGSGRWPAHRELSRWPQQAWKDFEQFLVEAERRFNTVMLSHIKEGLGAAMPVSCNNEYSGLGSLYAQTAGDYMNVHSYYDHPDFPGGSWDREAFSMQQGSMVEDLAAPVYGFRTYFGRMARCAVEGMPTVISEWNQPFPSQFEYEAVPLTAAVAAIQDWDAMILFAYDHGEPAWNGGIHSFFDVAENPVKRAQLPLAARLFLRGAVAPASKKVVLQYTWQDLMMAGACLTYSNTLVGSSFPAQGLYTTQLRVGSFSARETGAVTQGQAGSASLVWQGGPNACAAAGTAAVQMAVGHTEQGGQSLEGLRLSLDTPAAVMLLAENGEDIADAGLLLLSVCSGQQNTGQRADAAGGLASWGDAPVQTAPVCGEVAVKLDAPERCTVYALDADCRPAEALAARAEDGWLYFTLAGQSLQYAIVKTEV